MKDEPKKRDSFFDPEFYDKVKSGEIKILTAEVTTVEKYFTRNVMPILVLDEYDKVVRYIHKFSSESLEMAETPVNVNLITQEAYVKQ